MSPADLSPPSDSELRELCRQLSAKTDAVREEAETRLRAAGTAATQPLLDFVAVERESFLVRRTRGNVYGNLLGAPFLIGLSLVGFLIVMVESAAFGLGCAIGAFLLMRVGAKIRDQNAVRPSGLHLAYTLLAEREEPRLVGLLLEVLRTNETTDQREIEALVLRVLPKVSEANWQKLTKPQRETFYLRLQTKANFSNAFDEPFVLAGIAVLKRVGDTEAIVTMGRISADGNSQAMRQTARECLAFLETRREQQNVSQTLLRAASSDGQESELLRAAAPVESSPDELLRAGSLGD